MALRFISTYAPPPVPLLLSAGSLITLTPETHPFLMRAARVSVGQLGIITRVKLRWVPGSLPNMLLVRGEVLEQVEGWASWPVPPLYNSATSRAQPVFGKQSMVLAHEEWWISGVVLARAARPCSHMLEPVMSSMSLSMSLSDPASSLIFTTTATTCATQHRARAACEEGAEGAAHHGLPGPAA